MPRPSTGTKIFWVGLFIFAEHIIDLHIVPVPNLLCQTKRLFTFSNFGYCASTKHFGAALNAIKLLV